MKKLVLALALTVALVSVAQAQKQNRLQGAANDFQCTVTEVTGDRYTVTCPVRSPLPACRLSKWRRHPDCTQAVLEIPHAEWGRGLFESWDGLNPVVGATVNARSIRGVIQGLPPDTPGVGWIDGNTSAKECGDRPPANQGARPK